VLGQCPNCHNAQVPFLLGTILVLGTLRRTVEGIVILISKAHFNLRLKA
jgi:hypothetical protein